MQHLKKVLKVEVGSTVKMGMLGGKLYAGEKFSLGVRRVLTFSHTDMTFRHCRSCGGNRGQELQISIGSGGGIGFHKSGGWSLPHDWNPAAQYDQEYQCC